MSAHLYEKAREVARDFGEAFVVFIGSAATPDTACSVFTNRDDAIDEARRERDRGKGYRLAPKVFLKRIKA